MKDNATDKIYTGGSTDFDNAYAVMGSGKSCLFFIKRAEYILCRRSNILNNNKYHYNDTTNMDNTAGKLALQLTKESHTRKRTQ